MSIKIENIKNDAMTLRIAGKLFQPELVATRRALAQQRTTAIIRHSISFLIDQPRPL